MTQVFDRRDFVARCSTLAPQQEMKDGSCKIHTREVFAHGKMDILIRRCAKNERLSQQIIYRSFYNFALAICDRYANNRAGAVGILNNGFLKVFKDIHLYVSMCRHVEVSFKGWMRKLMIAAAIEHFQHSHRDSLWREQLNERTSSTAGTGDPLHYNSNEGIVSALQKLIPGYRIVLNLFMIEGFTHEEIAAQLNISAAESKSRLENGRTQLKNMIDCQSGRM